MPNNLQVKVISDTTETIFQDKVNDFLKSNDGSLIDIKYQHTYSPSKGMIYSCLILYTPSGGE